MVFVVRVGIEGGGRRRVVGVLTEYFDNQGDSLFFKSFGLTRQRVPQYTFSFYLLAPNYALVVPLPSATIRSDFKLGNVYLLNEGFGVATAPHYTVILGQQFPIITYES
jgi:hypothetical protein